MRFALITLLIGLAGLIPNSARASETSSCLQALLSPNFQSYDFKSALRSKNLTPELIKFRAELFKFQEAKGISIWLRYNDQEAGLFSMVYHPETNQFESHAHVETEFQRRGLGLLMYVISAKIAHEKYGASLRMSANPSDEAKAIWNWIVQNGWGSRSPNGYAAFDAQVVDSYFDAVFLFFETSTSQKLPEKNELL